MAMHSRFVWLLANLGSSYNGAKERLEVVESSGIVQAEIQRRSRETAMKTVLRQRCVGVLHEVKDKSHVVS
jgi:hypothetical protein